MDFIAQTKETSLDFTRKMHPNYCVPEEQSFSHLDYPPYLACVEFVYICLISPLCVGLILKLSLIDFYDVHTYNSNKDWF